MIKTQVASGKPTWDVVDVPTGYCLRGGEQGLIEKLDFAKLPNAAAMPENYRSPYSVAYEFYSSVLAYSQTKYPAGAAPNSWADFWDVKKFPGRRALRNHPLATLEAALMADGVAPDKLYPLDVDRAFKKLEEIKPYITVWWTSGAQSAQLLNDGEVDIEMAWNGRVSALAGEGAKVGFTYNQGVLQNTSLCILKGAPNLPTAVRFLNEAVDPVNQANLPLHIDYGPANPKAFDTGVIKPERVARTTERAGQRAQAGADVLCLVVVAGRRSGRETLGRVHSEMRLAFTWSRPITAPRPARDLGIERHRPRHLIAASAPRTGLDAGIGVAGAAGGPAADRASGRLARLAVDLSRWLHAGELPPHRQ